MRERVFILLTAMAVAAFGSIVTVEGISEGAGPDELVKVKGKKEFRTTKIRPAADLARYSKLHPTALTLTVRDPGQFEEPTGSLVGQGSGGGIMPRYEDLTRLKQILNDALVAGLDATACFELADTAEPGTLVLHASVRQALCDETLRIRTADGEPSPVLEEATIVFELVDAESGVIVAHFEERRKNKKPKGASASEASGPWPWAASWAETAAADLCSELRRLGHDLG